MARFIRLTRSDGPREVEFYLNADLLSQFEPDPNGGSIISVGNAPYTGALGFGDNIRVKETPEQIESLIARRPHAVTQDILIDYKFTSQRQWVAEEKRMAAACKDICKITPDNIYAIFLDYTEKGTHSLYMRDGNYFEINADNLNKIIPQNTAPHFEQAAAQLPPPASPTVQPPYQKPVQLVLAL